nr:Alpha/Beta hydrolase fold [Ipomoea batatas]
MGNSLLEKRMYTFFTTVLASKRPKSASALPGSCKANHFPAASGMPSVTNPETLSSWRRQKLYWKDRRLELNVLKISDLFYAQSIKERNKIVDKVKKGGLLGFRRLIRQPVSSVIDGNGSESGLGHGNHLVAPRVPYLREAMQEHHHWTRPASGLGYVDL